jgi:DNA-binding MarR family transcriptional regulator/N-acetylglutamate synthase-like GNAT family acetyltransferase
MQDTVSALRSFNRFHTRLIGALDERFLGTDLTLPEARLLFEIANREQLIAADLQTALGLDAGYLSRMLARFEARGWIRRERGVRDARQRPISLTPAGRAVFDELEARQRLSLTTLIDPLDAMRRRDLVAAMGVVQALLDPASRRDVLIRTFEVGDLSLLAARQAVLYDEVYGWGRGLELNEAEVVAAFLRDFKPGRDQGWIAEVNGAMAGSILLTDEGDGLSRLRLMYVEPMARGLGLGDALVATCVAFAREVGYLAITLWTHTVLTSARRIYAAHGFRIVETAVHHEFGEPVQGETWRLDLTSGGVSPDA